MFVLKNKNSLSLLKGGQRGKLEYDINYYYDNMLIYAQKVKEAVRPYQQFLSTISEEVIKFDDDYKAGIIHGCIVDISFFSHIYVNPLDGKVTPYWASDIRGRFTYESVRELVEHQEPKLLDKFLLEEENGTLLITGKQSFDEAKETDVDLVPQWVIGTEMYEASRIMRAIQYLWDDNIIRIWNDDVLSQGKNTATINESCKLIEDKHTENQGRL
jgi:hypothetical protein